MNGTASKNKRVLEGSVVSNRADKTIVVEVKRTIMHPRYRKTVRSHKKYMAHDPENSCNPGDRVRIIESRPLSKRKAWMLVDIVSRAEQL